MADMKQAESGKEMGGMHGLAGVKGLAASKGYGSGNSGGLSAAVSCVKRQTSGTDKNGNPSNSGAGNEGY